MADDTLRLVAKVTDEFSGPLGKLKKELVSVGDETKKQGANWRKDWSGVREDVTKFQGALRGIEPILSRIGVGGFGAAMSFGGAALALKNFSGSTRDLSVMARQIGLTANELRTLSELGGKVGVSADTMKGAINQFAGNMVDLRQRWGQAYGELRNMNLGKLAEDLVNAPTMEAAVERAMEGLKGIPDAQKRARVSTMLFGTPDVGIVASSLNGPIREAVKKLQAELGVLDKSTLEAAERFEQNLNRMHHRWEKLKLKTLGPLLEGADKVLEETEKERKAAPSRMRQDEIRRQLDVLDESIARKQANGDEAGATETKRKRDALAAEMQRLTDEIRKLREGGGASVNPTSFGGAGGGGGSLIHKAAWGGFGGTGGTRSGIPDYGSPGGGGSGGGGGGSGGRNKPEGPEIGDGMRGRPFGSKPAPGGAGTADTPRGNGRGNPRAARTSDMMRYAMDQLRREGVPEAHLRQAAAHLVGQAQMESGLDPNKVHDHGTGYGIYGARDPGGRGKQRRSEMLKWLKANGYAVNSAEGQMRYMSHEAMNDPSYRATRRVLMGEGTGNVDVDTDTITKNFERPAIINRRSGAVRNAHRTGPSQAADSSPGASSENGFFPNGAPRALKPKSMADDPKVPGQVMDGGFTQTRPWTKAPGLAPTKTDMDADGGMYSGVLSPRQRAERAGRNGPRKGESFRAFLRRRVREGAEFGRSEDDLQPSGGPTIGGLNNVLNPPPGIIPSGEEEDEASIRYRDRQFQSSDPAYRPDRELSLDEIRDRFGPGRGSGRKVGDALMDRFYGKGSAGGGPGMQMPGGSAGGKGKLDIHLHGFPQGAQARASMDDLFKETNVSKGRSQMDMGRG